MKHKRAGTMVSIKNGPLKGRTFEVINFLVDQYQGKSIDRIKGPAIDGLKAALIGRGKPMDNEVVFGKLFPGGDFALVHDSELKSIQGIIQGGNKEPVVRKKKTVKKSVDHDDEPQPA